jgi:hypothetical protein
MSRNSRKLEAQRLESEFFQQIRTTLNPSEITLLYPPAPEDMIRSAMKVIPDFITSHWLRHGRDFLGVASDEFINDLVQKKGINPAAAERAVFALLQAGHLDAVPLFRTAKQYDLLREQGVIPSRTAEQCAHLRNDPDLLKGEQLVFPGRVGLCAKKSLFEWWRDSARGAPPPCDRQEICILRVLSASKPHLLTQQDIEARCVGPDRLGRRTIGRCMPGLKAKGLIEYPQGAKSGAAITPLGEQVVQHPPRPIN